MKNALFALCAAALVLAPSVHAGINGTYKARGTESDNGVKHSFTGTVTISNYKSGTYALKFDDGERVSYKFNFTKRLKETTAPQSVNCYSTLGTGTATFRYVNNRYKVAFTYKAKGANVRGSGTGTK